MIKIGFSTTQAWYSRLIRWFTKSKCSHTFVILPVMGVDFILEEGYRGYTLRPLSLLGDNVVEILDPPVDIQKAVEDSFHDIGQMYGYLTLFGMLWVMIGRYLGLKWRNPLASSHSMICSERVARLLVESGATGLDPVDTTPEDLRVWMKSAGQSMNGSGTSSAS